MFTAFTTARSARQKGRVQLAAIKDCCGGVGTPTNLSCVGLSVSSVGSNNTLLEQNSTSQETSMAWKLPSSAQAPAQLSWAQLAVLFPPAPAICLSGLVVK